MANREIPVYLFTGFMDSGKTSLIQETLFENEFAEGGKGIIIMCEDGDVEYDMDKLATVNFSLVKVENEEDEANPKSEAVSFTLLPLFRKVVAMSAL